VQQSSRLGNHLQLGQYDSITVWVSMTCLKIPHLRMLFMSKKVRLADLLNGSLGW
jgi:hypothetical protein